MFEEAVQRVLRDPRLRNVTFACGPTVVSAAEYGAIADLVERRQIRVAALPGGAAGRAYYGQTPTDLGPADTFYLSPDISLGAPNASPADMQGTALVLHEATHAIQDRHAMSALTRAQAEAAAFVAQSVYYRLYGESFRVHSLRLRRRRGMSAAHAAAGDRLLDAVEPVSRRLKVDRATSVPLEDREKIMQAVRLHPHYASSSNAAVGMNGIGDPAAP